MSDTTIPEWANRPDWLDDDIRHVMLEMRTWDDEGIPYVRTLANDVGMPVEHLRRILSKLVAEGMAEFGPISDPHTGRPKGSSYWLTDEGDDLRRWLP